MHEIIQKPQCKKKTSFKRLPDLSEMSGNKFKFFLLFAC